MSRAAIFSVLWILLCLGAAVYLSMQGLIE